MVSDNTIGDKFTIPIDRSAYNRPDLELKIEIGELILFKTGKVEIAAPQLRPSGLIGVIGGYVTFDSKNGRYDIIRVEDPHGLEKVTQLHGVSMPAITYLGKVLSKSDLAAYENILVGKDEIISCLKAWTGFEPYANIVSRMGARSQIYRDWIGEGRKK